MAQNTYPDNFTVRLPAGSRERVRRAAAHAQTDAPEWFRQIVRKALDASERSQRGGRAK